MDHIVELGEFLRSCRGRLDPVAAGMPRTARRRVPGLRREELAQLAGVSVDYYTRLEQGRSRTASPEILQALAIALRLNGTERAHLFDLANRRPAQPRQVGSAPPERISPAARQLLTTLDTAYCPAFVLGRHTAVVATNPLARALIADFDAMPAHERNQARFVFLDPAAHALYADWEAVAADTAAMLRMDAGRHPDDPRLGGLVVELAAHSECFREYWAEHRVHERTEGTKRYHHPVVGDLTVTYQALALPGGTDQTLFVYTAEPGSPSETALRLLAAWSGEPLAGSGARTARGQSDAL
ncbi:helix-turn-helix domain-containing protein [Streptomyces rhizosphaericus]|uniref:Helix-turn-helix transcriptional regulator n=1 Tax=Streptomyces rhizosphaericus TaxID=114699 RepID=A0A6G4AKD1_9ACTN|nr:helix-turn-helix transcriptional regulator [Streptomyces rhizosphaericus]NEW72957.1 helix-turn-helix transcriptional regulator [Streptomyces rhizosphaericus]